VISLRSIYSKARLMRLWLSKNSEVPLREQLATQVLLGIVSGDLKPGQKLPSIRELSLRHDIHSNTVSAAYRDLARRGWVEFRKGSGVYVIHRDHSSDIEPGVALDGLVDALLRTARERGHSLAEIQASIKRRLESQPPDHFLVIERDPELRNILVAEINDAIRFKVKGIGLDSKIEPERLAGAAPVAMYGEADLVRAALPDAISLTLLRLRSIEGSIAGQRRPADDDLVTVVSRWPDFLKWARTVLVAAAIAPDAMSFRDARRPGWKKGLDASAMIITDALTATALPERFSMRIFRIISDSSIQELIRLKSFFVGD